MTHLASKTIAKFLLVSNLHLFYLEPKNTISKYNISSSDTQVFSKTILLENIIHFMSFELFYILVATVYYTENGNRKDLHNSLL